MKCGIPMLWDIDDWVEIGIGDINRIEIRYSDYLISTPSNQPYFEDVPEAVIWPQHAKVLWN